MSETAIRYLTMLRMIPRCPRSITAKQLAVTVTVGDTQDLRWWLSSQAEHCDIIEPLWLRDEIEHILARGLGRLRRSSSVLSP